MFRDRKDAGNLLAKRLAHYKNNKDVLVLALPRGGVVTGFAISRYLNAPLDVLIVRKLGLPWQPELAVGAVSETGTVFMNQEVVRASGVSEEFIKSEIARQREEINRRIELYRKGRTISNLDSRILILVDDGVATGATMKAAIETLRKEKLKKLVAAVPVAAHQTAEELREMVDELICLETPYDFMAVGNYYDDFAQVTDDEVIKMLEESTA